MLKPYAPHNSSSTVELFTEVLRKISDAAFMS